MLIKVLWPKHSTYILTLLVSVWQIEIFTSAYTQQKYLNILRMRNQKLDLFSSKTDHKGMQITWCKDRYLFTFGTVKLAIHLLLTCIIVPCSIALSSSERAVGGELLSDEVVVHECINIGQTVKVSTNLHIEQPRWAARRSPLSSGKCVIWKWIDLDQFQYHF